ncbi:MAG: MFS transporter, partial [Phenylobacterium sp.]
MAGAVERERPRLGWLTMLGYCSGVMARGLKSRAMSVFMLLYYNQVLGLSPGLVSSLIFISVIFDAIVDPIVGQMSDNFRSRLGRRHPFMYAAIIPVPVLFFALWNPPVGQSDTVIAIYFTAVLLSLQFFDTLYELPSSSLLPELVQDYDKRSIWIACRSAFSYIAMTGISILAYSVFLKENPDGTGGVLSRDGYFSFALFGALVIFTVYLISTLVTHRQVPWLTQGRVKSPTLPQIVREAAATLKNVSFLSYTVFALAIAVSGGVKNAMDIYFNLYVYGIAQSQMAGIYLVSFAGLAISVFATPLLIRRFGRRDTLCFGVAGLFVCLSLPLTLWLFGLAPPKGSHGIFLLLVGDQIVLQFFGFLCGACGLGLLADIVEDAEVKTGRRSEG